MTIPSLRSPIRFARRFLPAVLSGRKTCTTRQTPKGKPGDVLPVADEDGNLQGFDIRLLSVERVRLGDVAERFFADEGFDSPEGFIEAWREIYGMYTYFPETWQWLHRFEVVDDNALEAKLAQALGLTDADATVTVSVALTRINRLKARTVELEAFLKWLCGYAYSDTEILNRAFRLRMEE